MILQIATLGLYDNDRVVYAATKRRIDKLVLVSTRENRDEVEARRAEFKKSRIPFDSVEVEPNQFIPILTAILDIVAEHPGYQMEFNASCGTRLMAGALQMAAYVVGAPIVIVGGSTHDDEYEMEVIGSPMDAILTASRRDILSALEKMGGTSNSIRDIAEIVGLSDGQVSRQVNALHRAGYVVRKRSRSVSVEITEIGRVVLRVKQLRKERGWGKERE